MRSSVAVGLLLVSSMSAFGIYGRQRTNPNFPPGPEPVWVNGQQGVYHPVTGEFIPISSSRFDETCDLIQQQRQAATTRSINSGNTYTSSNGYVDPYDYTNHHYYTSTSGGVSGAPIRQRHPFHKHAIRQLNSRRHRFNRPFHERSVIVIRATTTPRQDWQKTVEAQGFHFHTAEGQPYWDESAYYRFSAAEIDTIEAATYELDKLCQQAVEYVLDHSELLNQFDIPPAWMDYIKSSWESDEITIYGRFDLAYDGTTPPKLLEYNADTPTGLLEAAVVQWYWLKNVFPKHDQFNSIHERLIEAWQRYKPTMRGSMMYFSSMDNMEDFMTVSYLQDTAVQAGLDARYIQCEDIGWHPTRNVFTDLDENEIQQIFKLYPWEWLVRDQFSHKVKTGSTKWIEASWKMILSNKAILAVLWQLFPNHPNLLPTSFNPIDGPFVRKPVLAREGSNIYLKTDTGAIVETAGKYGPPYVYQQYQKLPSFDGNTAVIGSWMVNGYACGIGIREDRSLITGNLSRFVPHLFS